jgi:SAM-dependent methyltransferase
MGETAPGSFPAEGEAAFWRERARKVGHTGWKQPLIYAFDQRQRLRIVDERVRALGHRPGALALDFGCGTGDFSRLLLELGYHTVGYDPHFAPSLSSPRFSYVGERSAFDALRRSFDLILSVTVLDHLIDDEEFAATLRRLRELAAPDGKLLLLEYAPDDEAPSPAAYQAYRSLPRWREALGAAGWWLTEHWGVPHPIHAPSRAYARYQKSLRTRLLGRALRLPILRTPAIWALGLHAGRSLESAAADGQVESPLKLMLCEPRHGETG